jgi:HEAT repeat protein
MAGIGMAAPNPTISFNGAKWIWYDPNPDEASMIFPGGEIYLRRHFELPVGAKVQSADLIITADNLYSFYLNGQFAGEGHPNANAWSQPKHFEVAAHLTPGKNLLAVEAINTVSGAAGLIVKLEITLADGRKLVTVTDENWKGMDKETPKWMEPGLDDAKWQGAVVVGDFGVPPWGNVVVKAAREVSAVGGQKTVRKVSAAMAQQKQTARRAAKAELQTATSFKVSEFMPPEPYAWPEGLIFVGEDCSLNRPLAHTGTSQDSLNVTIFNPRNSRGFPEHDLPAPMKVGRKLLALKPARPGVTPRVLWEAGQGALGSPSVSFDGQRIYFSMVPAGEAFFHIYRLAADGQNLERLTDGPFHDIDPVELPDGRLVFTSTRIGYFEEYHNPPSRSLFIMNAKGGEIRPLTHTFIFDNEPEVMADGRILFIRTDNFFDRGKVETLLHAVHLDGTEGYTEFGLDMGPDYGGRLRAFVCGSPAPLPDGRVAFLSGQGITVGSPGSLAKDLLHLRVEAGDVAAVADGRLLCTTLSRKPVMVKKGAQTQTAQELRYEKISVLEIAGAESRMAALFDGAGMTLHSPVFLGVRPRPPQLVEKVKEPESKTTGVLFCQNARFTRNTTAGWQHVRAIRVLAGKGLTVRSSHSYIVHAGSEVTELGTVPLAPDGSFAVEVPADTAIAFQAVDAEGRSEINEMSWIYVRPGETRGCVGCHQPRQASPLHDVALTQAMRTTPLPLLGQGSLLRFRGNNAAVTGLMEMQFDRYREVASINRHSDTLDPLATGRQEVSDLIQQLLKSSSSQQIAAIQKLAVTRTHDAANALTTVLKNENREVRVAAATALAACGTRESAPALLQALRDDDPLAAQAAAMALENLSGCPLTFNAFVPTQAREKQVLALKEWFAANPWPVIEKTQILRLQGNDRDVVRRAAVSLGHIGGSAASQALRAYLEQERGKNPFPEWRKTHHGDGTRFNSLADVNPRAIQAVVRALGYLHDTDATDLLAETLLKHADPAAGNLFLAEAAAEALGEIGTPAAERALVATFVQLKDYPQFTSWYGDHGALMACHASPVHYYIMQALDTIGSTNAASLIGALIQAVPTDPDRALFLNNDDYEVLTGRVIRRQRAEADVVETCLKILGDPAAKANPTVELAIQKTHQAWGGKPDPENRAAQILSLVCRDRHYEPRIRAAFERYIQKGNAIPRLFDVGIPVVKELPIRHWVSFFLARTLGNLADPQSTAALVRVLETSPTEAAGGRPDPLGAGVLFIHNDLTPCWRAATAWALGQIKDKHAVPVLLKIIGNMENATDTRHAAAEALELINDADSFSAVQKLAANYPEVSVRKALLKVNPSNGTSN